MADSTLQQTVERFMNIAKSQAHGENTTPYRQ